MDGHTTTAHAHEALLASSLIAFVLRADLRAVYAPSRGTDAIAQARQIAMYLMYVTSGLSLAKVALAFGRDRSTVAHACHQVEDRRDDDAFDAWIEELESIMERVFRLRELSGVK